MLKKRGTMKSRAALVMKQLLLCGVMLMLSSCIAQKMPVHEPGYGLIAVPYKVINRTTYPLVRAIELKSSADESFSIRVDSPPLNDDVVFSAPIPAGTYVVDYLQAVTVPVSGVLERGSTGPQDLVPPVRITLKDGEVVLFPMLFEADQYNKVDFVICRIDHAKLDTAQQQYYLDKLPNMENGSQWRVVTVE